MFRTSCLTAAVILTLSNLSQLLAVTPDSPQVRTLVDKGVQYLQAERPSKYHFGEDCLVAYALYKAGATTDPKVGKALQACHDAVQGATLKLPSGHFNYEVSVAIILLANVEPEEHRSLLDVFVNALLDKQLANGAWTYDGLAKGDTSQTQYALLALWFANQAGVELPSECVDRAVGWYLRTQDTSGGFVYQPNDTNTRTSQGNCTHTMTAGALGSIYIGGDLVDVGLYPKERQRKQTPMPGITKKERQRPDTTKRRPQSRLNRDDVKASLESGARWLARNYTTEAPRQSYYYLYALERYFAFYQRSRNIGEKEPKWYNDGVEYLKRTMQDDGDGGGYWLTKAGNSSPMVDTSFALLFLVRVTGTPTSDPVIGVVSSGPPLSDLVGTQAPYHLSPESSLDYILDRIAATEAYDDLPRSVSLSPSQGIRDRQIARLRKLLSGENQAARLVAVRALGRSRNFDHIPALIYALTDPDLQIVREARDSLRFVSRKFHGYNIPDDPTPQDIDVGIAAWKSWYRTIRPSANADFLQP